jgi:hypothetical protein
MIGGCFAKPMRQPNCVTETWFMHVKILFCHDWCSIIHTKCHLSCIYRPLTWTRLHPEASRASNRHTMVCVEHWWNENDREMSSWRSRDLHLNWSVMIQRRELGTEGRKRNHEWQRQTLLRNRVIVLAIALRHSNVNVTNMIKSDCRRSTDDVSLWDKSVDSAMQYIVNNHQVCLAWQLHHDMYHSTFIESHQDKVFAVMWSDRN